MTSSDEREQKRQKAKEIARQYAAAIAPRAAAVSKGLDPVYRISDNDLPSLYRHVPSLPPFLVGRNQQLDQFAARLRSQKVLAISGGGQPGTGKRAVAIALAHRQDVLDQFPDGVLWTTLGPYSEPMAALADWSAAFGYDLAGLSGLDQRRDGMRQIIGQKRLLIVLEDPCDTETAAALRCGGPNCGYLLTSGNQRIARGFAGRKAAVELLPLEEDAAAELLVQLTPRQTDPQAVAQLASKAVGNPMAIQLLAGYLSPPDPRAFPELASQLEGIDLASRLDTAAKAMDGLESSGLLTAIAQLTIESLPDSMAQAFYALGAFAPKPLSFSRLAAEAVSQADLPTLAYLGGVRLIEISDKDLALHPRIAGLARRSITGEAEHRHRDHYLKIAIENEARWPEVEIVYPQIKWAWQHAPENEALFDWIWALRQYQTVRGLWTDQLEWTTRALEAASRLNMVLEIAQLQQYISQIHQNVG